MPCYNESATLEAAVARVLGADTLSLDIEVIIVNDGSSDNSAELAEAIAGSDKRVRLINHAHNSGKGAAIRTGFSDATGDVIIIQDTDMEYSPADFPKLLRPIVDGRADVVFGSRFRGGEEGRVLYYWHSVGNRFLTLLSNMFTNLNLTDMETGYKVIKREIVKDMAFRENRFGIEPELTARLARHKPALRIYEVGISYAGRTYAEGKKINWQDGVRAIYCIFRYNLFR
jgi:glycosyltransferase involved in cell wall biosynthesis